MRLRYLLIAVLCCVGLLSPSESVSRDFSTEHRTALVVGNSRYVSEPLKNPRNDAGDMAAALEQLGFEVDLHIDTDRRSLRRAIRTFGQRLKQGGVGLFYYAGHGMQYRGQNFLIPIDADIRAEDEIPDFGVDAGMVLRKMETAGNPFNMVFLDACRDNPFARSFRSSQTGLTGMDAPSGTLIVYATDKGDKAEDGSGRNGTFTERLLKYLPQPNLEVGSLVRQVRADVLKATQGRQIPWSASSLIGQFYFNPLQVNASSTQRDREFWAAVKDSNNASDFQAYLDAYPNGEKARLARLRISQLESSRDPLERTKVFTDPTTGMEFVLVPGGCYMMGQSEKGKRQLIKERGQKEYDQYFKDDLPRHEVCVDALYVAKHEVTVGQFRRFVKATGYRTDAEKNSDGKQGCYAMKGADGLSWRKGYDWNFPGFIQEDNQPVVCVSWNDSQKYIDWLNRQGNQTYRLATEAEWEYAARGNSDTIRFWGDDPDQACSYANVADRTKSPRNTSFSNKHECSDDYWFTSPVGTYRPNPFGLYDMLGNVWEWTGDRYSSSYYKGSPRHNPQGSSSGSSRVIRGGSWGNDPAIARAAARYRGRPGDRSENLGFRLVLPQGE